MTTLYVLGLLYLLLLLPLLVYLLFRNNAVCHERIWASERIHELNLADIDAGRRGYERRWDLLREISYNQMFCQVWRPVRSFFANRPELTPEFTHHEFTHH